MTDKIDFIFKDVPGEISWPCTISVPLSGGTRQEQQVVARFEVIGNEEFTELAGTPLSRMSRTDQGDLPLLKRVLKGFDGLTRADGSAVSDEVALPAMFGKPYAVTGLVRGYLELIGERVAKN